METLWNPNLPLFFAKKESLPLIRKTLYDMILLINILAYGRTPCHVATNQTKNLSLFRTQLSVICVSTKGQGRPAMHSQTEFL